MDPVVDFVLGQDVGSPPVDPGSPPAQRFPPTASTVNTLALASPVPTEPLTPGSVNSIMEINSTALFSADSFGAI